MSPPTVFEIPADVNYNAPPFSLPEHFLRPAPPPIDAEDWPKWRILHANLSPGRRAISAGCRRHALHIAKDGPRGSVESINPIACGDRAACPRCALTYDHERWWSHYSTLGVVAMTQRAPMHLFEFRASVPAWNAGVRVAGCERSETCGRLCLAARGCALCNHARAPHGNAARIEADLNEWILAVWKTKSPHSGGVRHTRLEQPDLFGPIEIVITLHVPAVAVKSHGGAKLDPSSAEGQLKIFEFPEVAQLTLDWVNFVQINYGGVASLKHAAVRDLDIAPAIQHTHRTSIETFADGLSELPPGTVLPPHVVPTFVRACGLATPTAKGGSRKVQRSAWFGCLTGSAKSQTLNRLKIIVRAAEPQASVRVIDHLRILEVADDTVTVQSTKTAEVRKVPRSMVRLACAVDILGRPTGKGDTETWGVDGKPWNRIARYGEEVMERLARARAGESMVSVPWTRWADYDAPKVKVPSDQQIEAKARHE